MGQKYPLSGKKVSEKLILRDDFLRFYKLILITDGSPGIGKSSVKQSTVISRHSPHPYAVPFEFPCDLHVVCIASPEDPDLMQCKTNVTRTL